jgi:hypothetical protein
MTNPLDYLVYLYRITDLKIQLALLKLANYKHRAAVFYGLGIIIGWLLCSEYQVYLETGRITTFPWEA